jgi:hypothetical protein
MARLARVKRLGVLTGGALAAIAVLLAVPAGASADPTPFQVGAATVDTTPPAFDAATDVAYFDRFNAALDPACPRSTFNGPRLWKFEEPYQDTDGSGDFNYPISGGGGGVPTPEPFCDYNHNGRWDGIYSSGGIDKQETSIHDPIDARAIAIGDGTHTVAIVSVVAQGLHGNYLDAARDLAVGTPDAMHPDRRPYGNVNNIVISANHNESSPDTVGIYGGPNENDFAGANSGINDYYYDFLATQIAHSTAQAFDSMQPASLRETEFDVPPNIQQELSDNFPTTNNEDPAHPDHFDTPVAIDPKVRVLQARTGGGSPIFTMANVAAHNQEIGHSPNVQKISSDWPGYFHRKLEQDLGGMGMFLVGDNGSMEDLKTNPRNPFPECNGCFEQAQNTGEALAATVESHLSQATDLRSGTVSSQRDVFDVPLENNVFRAAAVAGLFGQRQLYTAGVPTGRTGPDLQTSVAEVKVGPDLQFIANPGEAFPALMLGSPWGVDDPDGLHENVGCPNRPNPSVPTWHASGTHRFQIGLANDMIGYEIPAWAFSEIPGVFTNQPPNADTCTNDMNSIDPAGHKHKLETEGVGPSASNAVADHLMALLNQSPDPTAEFPLGRFIHAPDANHPTTWLSRRAHDTRGGVTSDAIGIWVADQGSTDLAAKSGTIVTLDNYGSFGSRPVDATGSFMDFDGASQGAPDLSTRGMLIPSGGGPVSKRYYVDVYPALTHSPLGDPTPPQPPGSGGGSTGGSGGGPTGPSSGGKLGLRVSPSHARARRRSCFQITVTAPNGSPVGGATASIGRKSKLTDGAGHARICRRFKNTGGRTLTASKPGFDGAAVELRVRVPRSG